MVTRDSRPTITIFTPLVCLALLASTVACAAPPHPSAASLAPRALSATESTPRSAAEADAGDLAKASQNPIADMISLPFQNNSTFGYGPDDDVQNVLNIQPVIPFHLNQDWNVITRTILPIISQPVAGASDEFGLGDTTFSAFFSPAKGSDFTWGVGPIVLLPTSSDDVLGAGEWGGGATAIGLWLTGPWVAGGLVSNVWSFESSAVDLFTVQPFVNYNLDRGWYLVTAPIITADWEASSSQRWTVPVGGGAGRVFRVGKQPVNLNVQYYNFVESPDAGGDWQLRIQLQFLFPKG